MHNKRRLDRYSTFESNKHFSYFSAKVLLIIGGYQRFRGDLKTVHVMDPSKYSHEDDLHRPFRCHQFPDLPEKRAMSVGGMLNHKVVVCGGRDAHHYFDSCVRFQGGKWSHFSKMSYSRAHASMVQLPDRLWITGGFHPYDFVFKYRRSGGDEKGTLRETEVLFDDGRIVDGPMLPMGLAEHCSVLTSTGDIYVIGGWDGYFANRTGLSMKGYSGFRDTYIFKIDENGNPKYSRKGPNLTEGRARHSCAVMHSAMHDSREVILVFGGYSNKKSIEVLDYQKEEASWEKVKLINGWSIGDIEEPLLLFVPEKDYIMGLSGGRLIRFENDANGGYFALGHDDRRLDDQYKHIEYAASILAPRQWC